MVGNSGVAVDSEIDVRLCGSSGKSVVSLANEFAVTEDGNDIVGRGVEMSAFVLIVEEDLCAHGHRLVELSLVDLHILPGAFSLDSHLDAQRFGQSVFVG